MKRLATGITVTFCAAILLMGCGASSKEASQAVAKWEYRVVDIVGEDASEKADFKALTFSDPTTMLNRLGSEGWELVSSYTEESTVFPNFGNDSYVNGLRDNARTSVVHFVFKRPCRK